MRGVQVEELPKAETVAPLGLGFGRLNGIREVRGSIPLSSTTPRANLLCLHALFSLVATAGQGGSHSGENHMQTQRLRLRGGGAEGKLHHQLG